MYDDEYNDIFTDAVKANQIMQEAKSKLEALFTEKIKESLTDAKYAEKNLSTIGAEVTAKEHELHGLENKLKDLKERVDKFEGTEAPRLYIKKFVENVTKGFYPGQIVYYVKKMLKQYSCPTCHGQKKITVILDGKHREIDCPDCINGVQTDYFYGVTETSIQDIHLRLCFTTDGISYWNFENIYLRDEDIYVPVDMVFATREEAETRVQKLNEKEKQNG